MAKAYEVCVSWGTCDDSSVVGIFLDEERADAYIAEHRHARELDEKQHEKCSQCKGRNYANEEDGSIFRFKNTCDKAKIKEDRHGLYCEHDLSEYYSITSNDYWKNEYDILG